MSELLRCATNADVLEIVRQSGRDYQILAETIYGLDILCVRTGGEKKPAIVVTAGAHAGEPAGVHAVLSLINTLETQHIVYVVPLRDPFGWQGFARCLAFALGEEVTIENHSDAARLLTERGTVIYTEDETHLIIALIADLVFASMQPVPDIAGPRAIERQLNRAMKNQPELVSMLAGKRICWPSNLTGVEGAGDFERAFSAFVTAHGVIADLNRQFTFAYPPIEVACLRALVDKVQPGLILDLHEGPDRKFYLFTHPYTEGDTTGRVATAVIRAMMQRGDELFSVQELARIFPETAERLKEPIRGLMVRGIRSARQGASLGDYCQRYGTAITLETGRWKSLAERIEQQVIGSLAAIREFENQHRL